MTVKTIYAAECGFVPDLKADQSAVLQAIFDGIEYSDGQEVCLQFKRGTYYISKAIKINNAKNLTVRGNGATVVAHFDGTAPVALNNDVFCLGDCDDIAFYDLFFDTDNPIGSAGRVVAIDRESGTVDVKIYDEFSVTGFEHIHATNSFDEQGAPDYALATYHPSLDEEDFVASDGREAKRLVGMHYDVIGDHLIRMKVGNVSPILKIGHAINIRYEVYGNTIFGFTSCRRVLLKNIIIYSAASFGATIRPRSEDFIFDNFCIRLPNGTSRLKAANADGIHALGLAGKLTLKNCNMEHMGDDTLNIHGTAGGIHTLDKENKRISMICPRHHQVHQLPKKWAQKGDTIYVYDSNSFIQKGSFVIESVDEDNNAVYCKEQGDIEIGDTLANAEYFASLHIDGCTVRNTRARGFLVQTHDVLIENSYIHGMSLPALLFAPDIEVWWEVGPTKNVEIRNNVIEHCAIIDSPANQGAIVFKACHDGDTSGYPAGVHSGVYIHDNRFLDIAHSAIFVSSAKNVRIENNIFTNCCCDPKLNAEYKDYDIVAINCRDVTIEGNVSSRGESTLKYLKNCE